jgi:putative NADPH-quinone reductase
MTKMILVIDGHPSKKSFTAAIADAYADGVRSAGGNVKMLHIGALKFDPSLHEGYREVMPLEQDLQEAQHLISEAKHITVCYPQWWGSGPAVLKGFVDRVFLPGFAFRYHEKGPFWDKLLTGRSGEIWLMSDSPWIWFFFKYWNSPIKWLKTATLEFCGIRPVKVHVVDRVRFLTDEQRSARLEAARRAGVAASKRVGLL